MSFEIENIFLITVCTSVLLNFLTDLLLFITSKKSYVYDIKLDSKNTKSSLFDLVYLGLTISSSFKLF